MSAKIWPVFMVEPEYVRELETQEREVRMQEWEDHDLREDAPVFKERDAA